jgi:hypothetical protein
MRPLQQAPVDQGPEDRSPDGLDRFLARFLRSEMPDPWPDWKAPSRTALPARHAPRRPLLARSRTALAASLLLLLSGLLLLGGRLAAPAPSVERDGGKIEATKTPNTTRPHRVAPKPAAGRDMLGGDGLTSSRRP